MRMIFVFIDGLGIGGNDPRVNPFKRAKTPSFDKLWNIATVFPTEVTMDVAGLPQSATGQTAIFTGINASKKIGNHLHGRPNETLKGMIRYKNIFLELQHLGCRVTNANVFRDEYFQMLRQEEGQEANPSVTTVMTLSAGLLLRNMNDYKHGIGVYHDITGQTLLESGYDVELISPFNAASRLYSIAQEYDFTMFEHFMTDVIGHTRDMERAVNHIELLDTFLGELLKVMDFSNEILLITSDHGNIEDMSVNTHTYNQVPTIVMGPAEKLRGIQIKTITDIMPAILQLMK